ncbi:MULTISPECIES: endolytic transglycosylase MltG [Streptomyces]|uniref:Endolytic murein transglycosylase n=2 Tax=Streptomyces TaxID=1883 RepID=A0ABU4K6N4_9ACTN|nr:endolytic transglycosylase MltG [Streptomyces roseolus]MDX2293424.1 endolytic transglycosylase MltG [Streptomyces roseolus]
MTEYGRGQGPEPWHPTDPLYGDQGWEGQQQYQQQPQQATPYAQGGQGYQDPYAQQGYGTDPYQQQAAYQQQYPQQGYVDPHAQVYGDQGQAQAYEQTGWNQGYDTPGQHGQAYDGNWETGQAAMAYNAPPADPYGGQQPDLYGTPEAYPPPQPPGRRQQPPQPVVDWEPEPEPEPVRQAPREAREPEESHPFFTGDDDEDGYEDEEPSSRRGRGGRGDDRERERRGKEKKRKGKNGVACLVVAAVLVGGVGGIGYFGYQFWQGQFGEAPDYAGTGTGEVQVEIPKGAFGNEIGNILKQAGVVKSVDAFVAAQQKNAKGNSIQAGAYTLKKEMSAESAVALMLDPASQANLIIPEGKRNAWVYEQLDTRLDLKPGTTKEIAFEKADSLGLPDWAKNHDKLKDPLEGFLFPASYPVAKGGKPEDALKKMVSRANAEYTKLDLEGQAKKHGVENAWELLTVASLVQAEGKTHDDFRKMAEVIYNRLQPDNTETNRKLQFDSALNYLKGQSEIKISEQEANTNQDPYNTYTQVGLPPGPISNPGVEALAAMLDPTKDGWMYFVATDGMNKTEFAKTYAEFKTLKDKFNANTD